jgi:hypothetical protein
MANLQYSIYQYLVRIEGSEDIVVKKLSRKVFMWFKLFKLPPVNTAEV